MKKSAVAPQQPHIIIEHEHYVDEMQVIVNTAETAEVFLSF